MDGGVELTMTHKYIDVQKCDYQTHRMLEHHIVAILPNLLNVYISSNLQYFPQLTDF